MASPNVVGLLLWASYCLNYCLLLWVSYSHFCILTFLDASCCVIQTPPYDSPLVMPESSHTWAGRGAGRGGAGQQTGEG